MPVTTQRGTLSIAVDGVDLAEAFSATADFDFERGVSQVNFTAVEPDSWAQESTLDVTMGAGTNDVVRFGNGILWEPSWQFSPPRWKVYGRGQLARLESYRQTNPKGQLPSDITGVQYPPFGQLVMGVLDTVGIPYDPANIYDDPTIQLGTVDPSPLRWQHNFTAKQYLDELQKVSVGRRLFETLGGDVYFYQIIGRPRADSDFTFTEGVDIFRDATSTRTVRKAANRYSISGFDPGKGTGRLTLTDFVSLAPAVADSPEQPFELQSDWIQTTAHAQALLDYWEQELARELVEVTFHTYRDDLLGPGQTISLVLPTNNVTEPCWLRGVAPSYDGNHFRQSLRLVGGGLPDDYEAPPWV